MSDARSRGDVELVVEALLNQGYALELFGGLPNQRRASQGNMTADCPLCGKRGKFSFSQEKPVWRCWSCGAAGDWFAFLRQQRGLDFRPALEMLAERANVKLAAHDPAQAAAEQRRASLFEAAHDWCVAQLREPVGQAVREYLAARGYTDDEVRGMELGAYSNQVQLQHHLLGAGFAREEIGKSGLLMKRLGGPVYQLTLPWHSGAGRILGLGVRAIKPVGQDDPKYLYTSGMPKWAGLPGLTRCRGRDEAVLVEGVLDALYLSFLGVPACGAGGNALTEEQRAMLCRARIKQLVVCYDRDERGQEGLERELRHLYQAEDCPALYVAVLPEPFKDPDELVRAQGVDAFKAVLEGAVSAARWHGARACVGFDFTTDRGRDNGVASARVIGTLIKDEQQRADFAEAFSAASGASFSLSAAPGAGGSSPPPPASGAAQSAAAPDGGGSSSGKQKDRATFRERDKFGLTPYHHAQRLAERVRGRMLYCPPLEGKTEGSGWLRWDGIAWRGCERGEILNEAQLTSHYLLEQARRDPELSERAQNLLGNWASQNMNLKAYREMATLARVADPELHVEQSRLDAHPHLVNLRNGVFNLDRQELQPHDKELLFTKTMPLDYQAGAECPQWLEFLTWAMTDPEIADEERRAYEADAMVRFLARVLGYCLTGHTWLQVWFFNFGRERSGKSTLHRVLNGLFGLETEGGYLEPASPELLLSQRGGATEHERRLARLSHVRLVTLAEINKGSVLDEAQLKRLTGQEPVLARRLYNEEFPFTPRFKLLFSANTKPVIRDGDGATFRRIVPIPWPNQVALEDRDLFLVDRLLAEASGIFNWMADGWLDLCERLAEGKDPLGPPPPVVRASAEYQAASDLVGQFVDAFLEPRDSTAQTVSPTDAHRAFKEWAEDEGLDARHLPGRTRFAQQVTEAIKRRKWPVVYDRIVTGMAWKGLYLRSAAEQLGLLGGAGEEGRNAEM